MEKTLYWYGKIITDNKKKDLVDEINTVYVDLQNLENCEDLLTKQGFIKVQEGYELTGHNDLYQFKFIR
jgi:hypothetical protein